MINRVVPDGTVHEKGHAVRRSSLASGPTMAHAATKRIVKARLATAGSSAPTRSPRSSSPSCSRREDLQNAVRSFLADGPGKATFEGK